MFCCYPFEHKAIPSWLTFGGWLGGRAQLALRDDVGARRERAHLPRLRLPPRRVARSRSAQGDHRATRWQMMKFYLFVSERIIRTRASTTRSRRRTYFFLPCAGVLAVLTGIAIWKPVQLAWLTELFGGYVWARYWHFVAMLVIVLLSVIHVFMVFAVDPYSLPSMITGNYDERNSPEARNARPFYHIFPRRTRATPPAEPT